MVAGHVDAPLWQQCLFLSHLKRNIQRLKLHTNVIPFRLQNGYRSFLLIIIMQPILLTFPLTSHHFVKHHIYQYVGSSPSHSSAAVHDNRRGSASKALVHFPTEDIHSLVSKEKLPCHIGRQMKKLCF